jgi:hypothetical protein
MDGKIYLIGGADGYKANGKAEVKSSKKVCVFDLAGAGHWRDCASMEQGRQKFGYVNFDGKVYVFGGVNADGAVHGAEVYNPRTDAWAQYESDHECCDRESGVNHPSALLETEGFNEEDVNLLWKILSICHEAFGDFLCSMQL